MSSPKAKSPKKPEEQGVPPEAVAQTETTASPGRIVDKSDRDILRSMLRDFVAEIYGSMVLSNPGYLGVVSPAWADAAYRHVEQLLLYSEKHNVGVETTRAAVTVYGKMLQTNPNYATHMNTTWIDAAFNHAKMLDARIKVLEKTPNVA